MIVGIAAGAVLLCVAAIVTVIYTCRRGGESTEMESGPGLDWAGEPETDVTMMDTTMAPATEIGTYGCDVGPLPQLDDMSEGIALVSDFL